MSRRKAPQNKMIQQAPENKQPAHDNETPREGLLAELSVRDAQLRRLLKAEHNDWAGTIARKFLRQTADEIRAEMRGDREVPNEVIEDE